MLVAMRKCDGGCNGIGYMSGSNADSAYLIKRICRQDVTVDSKNIPI